MTQGSRRMSDAAKAELIAAVEEDRIDDASEYARDFAAKHDLSPATIRSAISRLRRERGMLKRPIRRSANADAFSGPSGGRESSFQAPRAVLSGVALLGLEGSTDPGLARLAAAALILCREDERFLAAVAAELPSLERLYRQLHDLRESTTELSSADRQEIARWIETA
jgi:hypothetical protein